MLCYLYNHFANKQKGKKYEALAKVGLCRKPEYEINKQALFTEYGFHIYRTSFPISV
jgi:hypothetical protein